VSALSPGAVHFGSWLFFKGEHNPFELDLVLLGENQTPGIFEVQGKPGVFTRENQCGILLCVRFQSRSGTRKIPYIVRTTMNSLQTEQFIIVNYHGHKEEDCNQGMQKHKITGNNGSARTYGQLENKFKKRLSAIVDCETKVYDTIRNEISVKKMSPPYGSNAGGYDVYVFVDGLQPNKLDIAIGLLELPAKILDANRYKVTIPKCQILHLGIVPVFIVFDRNWHKQQVTFQFLARETVEWELSNKVEEPSLEPANDFFYPVENTLLPPSPLYCPDLVYD